MSFSGRIECLGGDNLINGYRTFYVGICAGKTNPDMESPNSEWWKDLIARVQIEVNRDDHMAYDERNGELGMKRDMKQVGIPQVGVGEFR